MAEVRTVWVHAHFKEVGEWTTDHVKIRTETRMVEKGLFNKKQVQEEVPIFEDRQVWKVTGTSDREIDGKRLSTDVEQAIAALLSEGYNISCVIPVISGEYKSDFGPQAMSAGSNYGWGYGYSFTEGVTIVGTKA
ncbi:MAG: hypothetical protein NUV63_13360 [Gallionella sp.]|nr:hypothetical protein [Gallionella sp.]